MAQDIRSVHQLLSNIAALPTDLEMIEALRRTPRFVHVLLQFAFGDHELALPNTPPLNPDTITTKAFVQDPRYGREGRMNWVNSFTSCGDMLAIESVKLRRLFVRGVHPTITDKKRWSIWRDIIDRCEPDEVEILESIRVNRALPGPMSRISKELVRDAFPGLLEMPVVFENPAEPYSCLPGIMSPTADDTDPSRVLERATATAERPAGNDDAARQRYAETMEKMIFPL
jgi:hypothetical protein